jgi:primosomal protein N'
MLCEVYLLDAPYQIDRPFDYIASPDTERGSIVKVPFGRLNTLRVGVCVRLKEEGSLDNLKPVHSVFDSRISFNEEMLGLCLFLKEHTLCTFGEAARAMLPPGALSERLNIRYKKRIYLAVPPEKVEQLLSTEGRGGIKSAGQREILYFLLEAGSADRELILEMPGVSGAHLKALTDKGIVYVNESEEIRNPYAEYSKKSRHYDLPRGTYLALLQGDPSL